MIVTIEELETRLGEDIPEDAVAQVRQLVMDATSVVEGYIGQRVGDPVPDAVRSVVGRMVCRALGQESGDAQAPVGATGMMNVAGSFTRQLQWSSGSTDGGVWISSQEKLMLRPFKKRRGVCSYQYGGLS